MRKGLFAFFAVAIMFIFIVGCGAEINSNLQRATGAKFNIHPKSVRIIGDSDLGLTQCHWKAEIKGRQYDCFSNGELKDVSCIPIKK